MVKLSSKNQSEKRESLLKKAAHQISKGFCKAAANIFTQLLQDNPKDTDALLGMAELACLFGEAQEIVVYAQQVLDQEPNSTKALLYIAWYYEITKQHDTAINIYQNLIMQHPDYWDAWSALHTLYDKENNIAIFNHFVHQVLQRYPENAYGLYYLGGSFIDNKSYVEAVEVLKKAVVLQPDSIDINYQLANAYYYLNYLDQATIHYKKASELAPHSPGMKESYALALIKQRKIKQAKAVFPALLRETDNPVRLLRLMLEAYGHVEEFEQALNVSEELYRRDPITMHLTSCIDMAAQAKQFGVVEKYIKLLLAKPFDQMDAISLVTVFNVARSLNDWALSDATLPYLQEKVLNRADGAETISISAMISKLHVISEPKNALSFIKLIHTEVARGFRDRLPADWKPNHTRAFRSTDRLRIGIVSGDFKSHVVSYFIEGWVKHYDRHQFALYCYANQHEGSRDQVTENYQKLVDQFTFVDKMYPRELAECIQNDGIHILIDLTGYTAGTLVHIMAYKPAPIVMTWLGYPCTTGCSEIDYVIGDKWLYTPQHSELFVEKMLVLPETCYFVSDYFETFAVDRPPLLENGYVTFGSMMNAYKINPGVVRVWTEIIKRIPESTLILNHPSLVDTARTHIEKLFEQHDFPMDRLTIISGRHKTGNHVFYYQDFDIMLDTFPQTGGTTTLETLLMGVPVISLVGKTLMERISYSFIQNCGVSNPDTMCAFTEEEYIEKAVSLVTDVDKLTSLRLELANNVRSSNIFSPRKITRHLEAAFIHAWNETFPDMLVDRLLDVSRKDTVDEKEDLKKISVTIHEQEANFLTVNNINDIYCYVLQEQSGWFDPEYRFIISLVRENHQVLDCCDDCGLYTIPLLNQVGHSGNVRTCFMTEGQAAMVRKATADYQNIETLVYDAKQAIFAGMSQLDFVRVSYEFNDDSGGWIARNIEHLTEREPVIFFSARQDDGFNEKLLSVLTGAGFSLYYYLPGIDALAPFIVEGEHDAYLINLVACKGKAEERLALADKLLRTNDIVVYQPEDGAGAFIRWCHDKTYAKDFIQQWEEKFNHPKDQPLGLYRDMLNAWALSQDSSQSLEKRYTALQAAVTAIGPLMNSMMCASLLWTVSRILADAGARQPSVMMLMELQSRMEQNDTLSDIPFIPVDSSWDNTPVNNRFEEWMLGATLETVECRRVFSSYFTNKEQLESFRIIASLGFNRENAESRLNLIRERFA